MLIFFAASWLWTFDFNKSKQETRTEFSENKETKLTNQTSNKIRMWMNTIGFERFNIFV